ncbi:MAG: hypothetical protein H6684_01205 [Deltaproteobacteria bacterium]|nr:hypothetical protein [Deltaproteobacteria bacterium]
MAGSLSSIGRRALRARLALIAAACVVAMGIAEAAVRVGGYDFNLLTKAMYYQVYDVEAQIPDARTRAFYRLRPGYVSERVTINSLGARSPERPTQKSADVYRIAIVGGSNVYGVNVGDEETWPARLERALNEREGGGYEVWNFGTPGYVPTQMTVLAREAVEKLAPDLVIYAFSNKGVAPLIGDHPIESVFVDDGPAWAYYFPESYLSWPSMLPYSMRYALLKHSAFYRLAAFYELIEKQGRRPVSEDHFEDLNVDDARRFLSRLDEVNIVAFVPPSSDEVDFTRYYNPRLRRMILTADGKPDEYRDVHPPAYVYQWYGDTIAEWLEGQGWFLERKNAAFKATEVTQ